MSIEENLRNLKRRIENAALSVGRDPQGIKLIAAVKNVPTELVLEALGAGLTEIGENKVQEARSRYEEIQSKFPSLSWHMIGHLQRNKVRQALDIFDIIQSVDSERLAREINQKAEVQGKTVPVLIEINTSGEETKYGVPAGSAIDLLRKISGLDSIRIQGLMTIAPLVDDPEKVRPYFAKLRKLSEKIAELCLPNTEMKYLSMGMTDDFEVAVQEGSNMVRIGRAIFGRACRQAGERRG